MRAVFVCRLACDGRRKSNLVDLLPTLISIAGGTASTQSNQSLDGIDLSAILFGKASAKGERPWFSYHGQQGEDAEHLAVTQAGWKLKVNGARLTSVTQLQDGSRQVELFHLNIDPFEETNEKDLHQEKVEQLGKLLVEHRMLQPKRSVPRYREGKAGFVPPVDWKLDPRYPNRLVSGKEPTDHAPKH